MKIEVAGDFLWSDGYPPKVTETVWKRFIIFQDVSTPKEYDDPLNSIKGVNLCSMPLCFSVLIKKLRGANFAARI